MSYRATIALLVATASLARAVPLHAEEGLPPREDRRRRPRPGASFAIRAPLALGAGSAVAFGAVVWLNNMYPAESSEGSTVEALFWLSAISVAVATTVYAVERPLDGDWSGRYGMAIVGAAVGTLVMAGTLAGTEGTGAAAPISLLAPAFGAILGYEMTRRGPAWAVLSFDGSRLALGVPLPQPRVIERRGRRDVAFEAPLLQLRF
jgi:hypothetical protein